MRWMEIQIQLDAWIDGMRRQTISTSSAENNEQSAAGQVYIKL
jgi:hypothetical protein